MQPDLALAQGQGDFAAALWSADLPAGIVAADGADLAARFMVYRNNVQHSLTQALASRFGVVQRLVGAEFFSALARAYCAQHPPRDPVLLHWGADFADFVEAFAPVAHLPYLGDVARLEYARGQAYHAADAAPVPPSALERADLDDLRLTLHPSVRLFKSRWPALQIWQANQPDAAPRGPLRAGPDCALIARAPDLAVITAPLDAASHSALAALLAGQPLGMAAQLADPVPALALLLRHGLIVDVIKGIMP